MAEQSASSALKSLSLSRQGVDGNAAEVTRISEPPLMCQLADACSRHFYGGGNPTAGGVTEVAGFMNRIRAQDLGLVSDGPKLRHIEFVDVLETPEFTVGIFLIPAGRYLPLHDHPGMTVLSKVIFGELLVTSFDKSDYSLPTSQIDFDEPFSALVRSAGEVVGCEDACKVLHPTCDGNLHEFVARTDCGLLDILAPPYDFEGGRPCNYFQVVEGAAEAGAAGGRNGGQLAVGSV